MEIIGHRGNGTGSGENTLASLRAGLRSGADKMEVDVQLHRGRLVIAHGRPTVRSPLLADVLADVDAPLVIHIKRHHLSRRHDRRVIDRLAEVLQTSPHDVTVASFWPGTLRYCRRRHPKLRTAFISWLPGYDLLLARSLGASELAGWWRLIGRRTVERAHARNLRLSAFTVPYSKTTAERCRSIKLDGVITDDVRQFAEKSVRKS